MNNNTNKTKKTLVQGAALVLLFFYAILSATNGFDGLITDRPLDNIKLFITVVLFMNVLNINGKLDFVVKWKKQLFNKN